MKITKTPLELVVIIAIFIAIGGCAPPIDDKGESQTIDQIVASPVNKSEIVAGFERADPSDIVYALNEVKKSPLDYDVVQTISCAYTDCADFSSDWNRVALSDPLVQVNIIDVLIQADQRGMRTVDLPSLKSEVVSSLSSPNPLVVQRSLLVISYLDNPDDIPIFVDVANKATDPITFRVAIIALKQMSTEEAIVAISAIVDNADEDQREAVADLIN